MRVQVVYCTHETADIDTRERLGFSNEEQLARAYESLRANFPEAEAVLLSTCNRVELYTAREDAETSPTDRQVAEFFANFHHVPVDAFYKEMLADSGSEAVRHLFAVASSLDSMVLGEPQIVSQVKDAYRIAQEHEACGPLTHALFQRAVGVSGRVRTETRLAEGRVSIASVAVGDFGKSIFERFDDKTVLVIGAGEMAEETLRYLKHEGVKKIVVVNRSSERAARLAAEWGGQTRPFNQLDRCMAESDVIVSTTGSQVPLVDRARFARVRRQTGLKPIIILDLGAPRDFHPAVGNLDENVFLYDIQDLQATCDENRRSRASEIKKAWRIIEEETDRFMRDVFHRATGPIISRLRAEWHDVRDEEVRRLFAKLDGVDERQRREIEKSIERIINKLLHPPLEALRHEAKQGTPNSLLDALKRLFHLTD